MIGCLSRVAMPVHDWTRVDAGIFHAFHHSWIEAISRALNDGRMPPDYYALPEQIVGSFGPDVLALQAPPGNGIHIPDDAHGSLLTAAAPRTRIRLQSEVDQYAAKAKAVTVRHISGHELVAVVEIVSPGNKGSAAKLLAFAEKARAFLTSGIHPAVWEPLVRDHGPYVPPDGETLTLVSYLATPVPQAFLEPTAVGAVLIDMPVFLTHERYVNLPLEATYLQAWEAVPAYWQKQIAG